MLLAFSLTACGAGAAGGANDAGSQDASQAAGQTSTGDSMEQAAAGESGAEGTGAQSDTEDSALPSTMEDGEVVLGQADAQSHFEGTLPDGTISWSDDMAAWIKIPGAGVDTAVEAAQTDGSVYLNPENSSAFNDPNTVIHGPADTEDAALHGILAYGDQDFFQKNPYVYVYLPDGSVFEYKVFAAYAAAPEDILKQHDCYDFDAFSSYVQEILSQRSMLSCSGNGDRCRERGMRKKLLIIIAYAAVLATGAVLLLTPSGQTSAGSGKRAAGNTASAAGSLENGGMASSGSSGNGKGTDAGKAGGSAATGAGGSGEGSDTKAGTDDRGADTQGSRAGETKSDAAGSKRNAQNAGDADPANGTETDSDSTSAKNAAGASDNSEQTGNNDQTSRGWPLRSDDVRSRNRRDSGA